MIVNTLHVTDGISFTSFGERLDNAPEADTDVIWSVIAATEPYHAAGWIDRLAAAGHHLEYLVAIPEPVQQALAHIRETR